MNKIAIVGNTGFISRKLISSFRKAEGYSIILIGRQNCDLALELNFAEKFPYHSLEGIDFVIFTAAVSSPDKCALDYDTSWKINVTGTKTFIQGALQMGCRVIFYSSDAVYGDIPGKIFDEMDSAYPQTPYGLMKYAVEKEFWSNPYFKSIRLSYVVASDDKFTSYLLKCIDKGEEAKIYHPFYRNMIMCHEVVLITKWLLENWNNFQEKVINAAGTELVSRLRLAEEIDRIRHLKLGYIIERPTDSFYQNRPAVTQTDSVYIAKYNMIKRASFTEALIKEMETEYE